MKLKYDFVIEEVAGQNVAMVVGDNTEKSGFLQLTGTGAYVLNLLKNETTKEAIIANIEKDFEVENIEEVKMWVDSFINLLKEADVLE